MWYWLWIFLTYGQILFVKANESRIFDATYGKKLISGTNFSSFVLRDRGSAKFGPVKNQPDNGIAYKLKKSDVINNEQSNLDKQSFEDGMMTALLSETMPDKESMPVLDGSSIIAVEKTNKEMTNEFREVKSVIGVTTDISQTSGNIHSVAEDALEKLGQSLISNTADEIPSHNILISNLKSATVNDDISMNSLTYTTEKVADNSVIWSNPQIFSESVYVPKFNPGHEILSVKAHDKLNSSIEFICMLPEIAFCVTDLLGNDSYRLRVVYTGSNNITNFNLPITIRRRNQKENLHTNLNAIIHFISAGLNENNQMRLDIPRMIAQQTVQDQTYNEFGVQPNLTEFTALEKTLTARPIIPANEITRRPKAPVFIFRPHFERNNYEIFVPEGKNKDSIIVAVLYFLTHLGDVEPKFSIQSEPLNWFYLGEIETETNENRLIVMIKLMLHGGADVDFRKSNNGQYKFQIKANQGSFETTTNVVVEILTFATKGTSHSFGTTIISSTTEVLAMEKLVTPEVQTDLEQRIVTDSRDHENGAGMIIATTQNRGEIMGIATSHNISEIQTVQTEVKDSFEIIDRASVKDQSDVQQSEAAESFSNSHDQEQLLLTTSQTGEDTAKLSSLLKELPESGNFAETSQSTVHNTETVVGTAESVESPAEKRLERPFLTKINGITRYQPESVTKISPSSVNITLPQRSPVGELFGIGSISETLNRRQSVDEVEPLPEPEIISVTPSEDFQKGNTADSGTDNLDVFHYSSVSSTVNATGNHGNTPTVEMDHSSEDSKFSNWNSLFSSNLEETSVVEKSTTVFVASSVQNSNNGMSLLDEFGVSEMSVITNPTTMDDKEVSKIQDKKHSDKNFGRPTLNFEDPEAGMTHSYSTTTNPANWATRELNTDKDDATNIHSATDYDNNYTDDIIDVGTANDFNTSINTDADNWRNNLDNNISSISHADMIIRTSDSTETLSTDHTTSTAVSLPQTASSLAYNGQMNPDYKAAENWIQSGGKIEDDKLQQIQIVSQLTSSDKTTIASMQHSESVEIETKTDSGHLVGNDNLTNDFKISEMGLHDTMIDVSFKTNELGKYILPSELRDSDVLPDLDIIITAVDMHPNDIIMVTVNSSALEVIPRRMQPGKTVFLVVRNAEKLYRDLSDGPLAVKVTASRRMRPSVRSSKVIDVMKDENLSNEAPTFSFSEYDFHVSESSITGQKVGQMVAEFADHREHGIITYQLVGPGSEFFAVNDGTVSVSCPSVLPCLDREQITSYHLLVIATNRNGLNSVPAIIRIHISDRNDNGPTLEISQNEITVSNGRLTKPFVVKVKDNDAAPHNISEITVEGTASAFISLEKVRDDIYYGRLWSLPTAGTYQLNISARDPDGNIPEQKITVNVQVLNTVTRAHFKRAKYERTVSTEKLFKGNPILQPELENAPLDSLRFILLRDDPGWLSVDEYSGNVIVGDVPRTGIVSGKYGASIAAVNRTDGRLITECVLVLTVISDNHVKKLFPKRLIIKTLRKDPTASHQTVQVLPESNKASIGIVRESISAVDEQLHYTSIDKNAVTNSHGMIMMDMKRLQKIRMLQFNLSSKEDVNDSARIMLFLSSEPLEMAHKLKRQAQPRFGHPWRSDMNTILIKLAENSPEGYTIISLPAYNPMNGSKILDLRLSGKMAQHFTVDGRSGDVQVVTPFDFEAMEPESHIFDLILTAGEEPYDTEAVLRVEIIDVDDNPPKITKFGDYDFENLTIEENSRPGTVLFEVQISDPDYLYGKTGAFNYALSGNGAANFQVKKVNDTVAVIVSPAADLDREKIEEMLVLLKVTDSGGNSDSIMAMITIIDANDNAPVFIHNEYKIEAVENWPEAMVLTYVHAEDKDKGLNGDIRYSLSPKNNQYFEIDPESGLIRTKKALIGLARAHSYDFSVVASDQGTPSLSASIGVSIHVLESTSLSRVGDNKGIHIVSPSVHFTLELNENTPANDRVYSVRAKIGGFNEQFGREIKYSITPVDNKTDSGWFTIDMNSGDLFTLKQLDHELQPTVTVSLF